jgi:hypothetical protein
MEKPKTISLKKLFYIDSIAAFTSGLFVFIFKAILVPFLSLPELLLTVQTFLSFSYAAYSMYLARRNQHLRSLLKVLILMNGLYAFTCSVCFVYFFKSASIYGLMFLALESLFVTALVILEWRKLKANSHENFKYFK